MSWCEPQSLGSSDTSSLFFCDAGCSLWHAGFLVAVNGGYSLVAGLWLLIAATSLVAEHGLSGARASVAVAYGLWSERSVVAVHGLSCSEARGIFLDQGSNSRPLH